MPTWFDLPALSDKDYAKLVQELTAAIPRYSDNWTDYNFSDPGTTLLQLLAWLGDITLYRIDTVPTALYLNFARWLVGASGEALDDLVDELENDVIRTPNKAVLYLGGEPVVMDPARLALAQYLQDLEQGRRSDLNTLRRHAIAFWSTPYRAVTEEDFRILTFQTGAAVPATSPQYLIRRVVVRTEPPYLQVIPITDYPYGYSITLTKPTVAGPLLLTLGATIQSGSIPYVLQCYFTLVMAIGLYLQPRRLLGTPIQVSQPIYNPVSVVARIAILTEADAKTVLNAALAAIQALLSASTGGPDGTGWPYGREVSDYDLLNTLATVPGIDHSQPIHVEAVTLQGFVLGASKLGFSTLIQGGPAFGLPLLTQVTIEARTDTWTLQVGAHARVGIDTVLTYAGL